MARSREKIETVSKSNEDHTIDMTKVDTSSFPKMPLPPQPSPRERVIVKPLVVSAANPRPTLRKTVNSARFFSIASLQEYTDSFSQENLVGHGSLATVYRAELPNGKVHFFVKNDVGFVVIVRLRDL